MFIMIDITLRYVLKGPVNNDPALAQIMAWRRKGDKPLSEPNMAKLTVAYMRHLASLR